MTTTGQWTFETAHARAWERKPTASSEEYSSVAGMCAWVRECAERGTQRAEKCHEDRMTVSPVRIALQVKLLFFAHKSFFLSSLRQDTLQSRGLRRLPKDFHLASIVFGTNVQKRKLHTWILVSPLGMNVDSRYSNKSAYVSLLCLIAFVVVISVCLLKQFVWDSLLAERFQTLRPLLSESMRKCSPIFYRTQSNTVAHLTMEKSLSEMHLPTNESSLLSSSNSVIVTPHLPSIDPSSRSPKDNTNKSSSRSYGSSATPHSYVYTNYGSEE